MQSMYVIVPRRTDAESEREYLERLEREAARVQADLSTFRQMIRIYLEEQDQPAKVPDCALPA